MNALPVYAACGIGAYLLGAVPFGYIIAHANGIDIYKTGSGSIGATNVFRSVGKAWGVLTFFLDALKGFIPAFLFPIIASRYCEETNSLMLALGCSALAVVGHNWPVYLGFKGGKGIATSAGALAGIIPELVGIALLVWIITFLCTRFVSVASITAAVALMACGWLFCMKQGLSLPVILTILGFFAIWRHRSNIKRLMEGTEHRFSFQRNKDSQQISENEENR